ncbi:MAG: branched-chain amino acid transport system substrate-binding protein [Acidimicrobiaceae bacterium]|jgi:ABC-type branched-subunit amino acid transport system substrate-binding protein|nr:branched-chain amino acid transport system substrate-binding protein [Acidimicrobiaceae bacterium]
MNEITMAVMRKALAVFCAAMLVTTLSAISIVRADNRSTVAAGDGSGPSASGDQAGDTGATSSDDSALAGPEGVAGATGPSASGGSGATSGGAGGGGGGASASASPTASGTKAVTDKRLLPHNGTDCPDYSPKFGVFCDHFLVGGTTVLSGPLAVYGDQGIKGGLAWIAYFNSVIAPKEQLRKAKLIWYDDNLDPAKTLQYVQRLNEVDHVLYLGGITSPESAARYLDEAHFPMIGDIGLSPKSYTNRYIFATAPSEQTRNPIRIKTAKERFGIKSFAVIQDVLPSVDTTPVKESWKKAAEAYGVKQVEYVEIASTASECSTQFSRATAGKPEYLVMPTASAVLLACLRAARQYSVAPGSANTPWLKGWSGGSNLQLEVDNCKPLCEGMLSIGTVFNDPRTSQTEQMKTYRQNMAKYAPNVDTTGFIAINYYHAGYVFYSMVKQKGIQNALTRDNLVKAAESFGPFETGFGNTITWRTDLPRVPWTCGYPVVVRGDKWVFDSNKVCL